MNHYCTWCGRENNEKRAVVFMTLVLIWLWCTSAMWLDFISRPAEAACPSATQAAAPVPAATATKGPAPKVLLPLKKNPKVT